MKHIEINIKGKVQGVSYRAATKAVADQLGVKGLIMNQADGSIFVVAEGDDVALEMFLDWCNEGPQYAEVTSVETIEGELKNYRNFEIVKKVL